MGSSVRDTLLRGPASLRRRWRARRAIAASEREPATVHRDAYIMLLRRLSAGHRSVLDLGCGVMRPLTWLRCPVKIGLDLHRPALEERQDEQAIPVNAAAADLGQLFVPGAVELVTMFDFIEHLEREDALRLLGEAERVASRRVVLFTPRGFFPQGEFDFQGLGGEELQRHRSGWEVDDLTDLGYNVLVLPEFHDEDHPALRLAFPEGPPRWDALLAWKDVGQGQRAR
jgi:hypothetical protein